MLVNISIFTTCIVVAANAGIRGKTCVGLGLLLPQLVTVVEEFIDLSRASSIIEVMSMFGLCQHFLPSSLSECLVYSQLTPVL